MNLKNLFDSKLCFFKQKLNNINDIFNFVTEELFNKKIIKSKESVIQSLLKRESEISTSIGDKIAIPHSISSDVNKSIIVFVKLDQPIKWNETDEGYVDKIFVILTNDKSNEHLDLLASLAKQLSSKLKIEVLDKCNSFKEMNDFFIVNDTKSIEPINGVYDIVAITACPTGIAHTYLAKEKLEEYAYLNSYSIKVETQGRRGTDDKLTREEIENAKIIILAHDKTISGMNRFNDKKVIDTNTKDAIYHGPQLFKNYLEDINTKLIKSNTKDDGDVGELSLNKFKDFKGNLLGGVSRMLPFVVAGGIILGIGFLIDFIAGNGEAGGNFGTVNTTAGWFSAIGKTAMLIMVPVLGGYISYSIVGPQGLMPGFIAGLLADGTGGFAYGNVAPSGIGWSGMWTRLFKNDIPMNSGFIGAMVGGYLAALIVFGLSKMMRNFSKSFRGVRDIVFVPVLSLLAIALVMFAIDIPLGYLMWGIKKGLIMLADHNLLVVLGCIISLMMCVDMGGPINKIAYVLGTMAVGGQLGNDPQITTIMAASMAGGMIPPLGIALCTILFRGCWSQKDKDAAKANWLMGAFFITEGAIPFMVTDPKRISVSSLIGGGITGLLVGAFKITLGAPHGGICVFPLLNSTLFDSAGIAKAMGVVFYIASILTGVFVMAFILGFWKKHDIKKGKIIIEDLLTISQKIEQKILTIKNSNNKNKDIKIQKLENKLVRIRK